IVFFSVDLTMYVGDATMGRNFSYLAKIYQKDHPDVNIDVVVLPYYGGFMQKVSLSIMSGEAPDLVQITTGYIFQVSDYLINLVPYVEEAYNISAEEYKEQLYSMPKYCIEKGDSI